MSQASSPPGCLIPVRWSSPSGPLSPPGTRLSAKSSPAGPPGRFMIVPFGFGLPRYYDAIANGCPLSNQTNGIASAIVPVGTGLPLLAGLSRFLMLVYRCLIPVRWSSPSGPLSPPGTRLSAKSSPTGGVAGSLHDSALWLRPPKVSGAIAIDCPPCSQANGIASATVPAGTGCLIPVRWSSPFRTLVSAGNTVVCEVFPDGSAGSLHDSALWLRPPKVLDAIANGCPPSTQANGIASQRPPSRWGRVFRFSRDSLVSSCSFTPSPRPPFPASGRLRR